MQFSYFLWKLNKNCRPKLTRHQIFMINISFYTFSLVCLKKIIPIGSTIQKIIRDDQWSDNRQMTDWQTDRRTDEQTDFWADPHRYMDPLVFRRSAIGTILNPKTGRDVVSPTFGRLTGFSVSLSEDSTWRISLEIIFFEVIYHLNELHRIGAWYRLMFHGVCKFTIGS